MNMQYTTTLFRQDLIEQLAGRLVGTNSEDGPFFLVLDAQGNCLHTRPDVLNPVSDELLEQIRTCIEDGLDPVVRQEDGFTIVATQLSTDRAGCGCILLILPGYTYQTAQANMELIEMLLAQVNLIVSLIDSNNQLCSLHSNC